MKLRAFLPLVLLLTAFVCVRAEKPVTWNSAISMTSDSEGYIEFTAQIADGWHMYAMDLPADGPTPTSFDFKTVIGADLVGTPEPSAEPIVKLDKMFQLMIGYWEGSVSFRQKFRLTKPGGGCKFEGNIRSMACNDMSCSTPDKVPFELTYQEQAIPAADSSAATAEKIEKSPAGNDAGSIITGADREQWWQPVEAKSSTSAAADWWYILLWGFLGGLLALLTPCVWPMIPLTVSFFLKKGTSRGRSIADAMIYGASIIVIYLVLGIAVTLMFGAGKLNELATNAVFNIIFFAILVIFAISFFGAFDIKLPSKWSNTVDSKAEKTTGMISIFFMAFTLVLVSFSCTGPLIGTLLVEAASQGNITGPALGMGAFALALAIPFTLFAIFPSLLKEMPRSGGWLNSVKVVLGFLELALSLKFLSVVDLAYGWRILDREVFLALWIVIFVLLGLYLLGKLRFSHDSELEYVSIPRFFLALASLSFAVYLLPGLWGAPLKAVSAFAPPLKTQDFNLYDSGLKLHFDDYNEGMAYAAEHNMPVLLDFSGHGCVNCRKMEGAVIDNPEVKNMIESDFVFITLMVDERKALPSPQVVTFNGQKRELETVGELWGYLQEMKFAASQQPFYIVLDNKGIPMNSAQGFTENVGEFKAWLESGLENYRKQ